MKVHEIAKLIAGDSKQVVAEAKIIGIKVKSASSKINEPILL